jgi:hypothetical protein
VTIIGEMRPATREVSVGTLLWLGLGALFVFTRLAGMMSIPVGGAELDALSGAWRAHDGHSDSRYIPTLFQGVTALSFSFTTSETPARVLALLASLSLPVALYRLRLTFGEVAMLGALLVLALDPATILFGSTASASGFDIAVALWLLVLANEARVAPWLYGLAGFAAATSGGIVLPLIVGVAALRLVRQDYPERAAFGWAASGAIVGAVVASLGFGFGWDGPVLSPVAAFGAGFDRPWSSEHTSYLALIYASPVVLGALAAVAAQVFRGWRDDDWSALELPVYAWFGAALLWLIAASGAHDPSPLAAVALPAALLIGMEAPGLVAALQRVEWRYASGVLAGMLLCLGVIEAYVVDWARVDRPGTADDKLIVTGLSIAVLACFGLLLSNRRSFGAVAIPPIFVGALLLFSGASGVAFGGPNEPLPSPVATSQSDEIRAIVQSSVKEKGGQIVVHPSFEDSMTWALRDTSGIVVASRIPGDATAVVWPVTEPAPEGYAVVEGQWSFTQTREGPDGGFLDYLRWLSNRNSLKNVPAPLAVYLKAGQ